MRPRHDSGTNVDQQARASAVSDSTASAPVTGPGDDDVTISTSAIDDDSISDILEASPRDLRASVVRFGYSFFKCKSSEFHKIPHIPVCTLKTKCIVQRADILPDLKNF